MTPLSVAAEGTQFKVTLADGRVLCSAELVGAVLAAAADAETIRLRIDAVEPAPGDGAFGIRPSGAVLLHSLAVEDANGGWSNPCEPGPDGRRQGFPLAGRALADSTIAPAAVGKFALACTGGVEGKCLRLGYHPWESLPDGAPVCPSPMPPSI